MESRHSVNGWLDCSSDCITWQVTCVMIVTYKWFSFITKSY
jgi:hypothetical protein